MISSSAVMLFVDSTTPYYLPPYTTTTTTNMSPFVVCDVYDPDFVPNTYSPSVSIDQSILGESHSSTYANRTLEQVITTIAWTLWSLTDDAIHFGSDIPALLPRDFFSTNPKWYLGKDLDGNNFSPSVRRSIAYSICCERLATLQMIYYSLPSGAASLRFGNVVVSSDHDNCPSLQNTSYRFDTVHQRRCIACRSQHSSTFKKFLPTC